MKCRVLVVLLIFDLILIASCKKQSGVEEGLSYDEYIGRARQYQNDNKIEKAISYYKKALTVKPNDGNTHYILGEIYYREYDKSYDSARKKHTSHVLTHPSPSEIFYKGDTKELEKYGLKKEYKELAMQEFREAIKYDPQNWMARYQIATNFFNNRQYKEAIKEYEKVIELNPKYNNAYSLMGEAYMELGIYDLAIKYLNIAIKLEPNFEYGYYTLGLVYRKMNNGEKVNEMLSKLKNMHSIYYDELRLSLYR